MISGLSQAVDEPENFAEHLPLSVPPVAVEETLVSTVSISGQAAPISSNVARRVIHGTSTLGLGIFIERGSGFLANLLAARFAGASTFGAYSLAISTANNISTYAAGGIGATATRFAGKYPYESSGYSTLARVLTIVSLTSAIVAAGVLWLGASPLSMLLGKPALTHLLRWAAISAAGIILLECARGFFVGTRRFSALVVLSILVGAGMLILLPMAARMHNPVAMITLQGAVTLSAVALCVLLARPLNLNASQSRDRPQALPLLPMLREVWSFGFVQLAGLVGANLAGLWLTTLVARNDHTLIQIGFFTIASQLRNLVGIAPSLLTEGSYAVMADPEGEVSRTPHRVMALCTFASVSVALLLATAGIIVAPWAIASLYGNTYAAAGTTVAIALLIAVVHMGNAPAAARLTIVSIRATGVINTLWAAFVALAACLFLVFGGGAWQAMTIYFLAHVFSSALVLITLRRRDHIPAGVAKLSLFSTAVALCFAALAVSRALYPAFALPFTGIMLLLFVVTCVMLYSFGRKYHWLPSAEALQTLSGSVRDRLKWSGRHV